MGNKNSKKQQKKEENISNDTKKDVVKEEETTSDDPQSDFSARQHKWSPLVDEAVKANFNKVVVIVGGKDTMQPSTWTPMAFSEQDCVAQQWYNQPKDEMINENEYLSKDWESEEVDAPFYFFKTQFKIVKRLDDVSVILCANDESICIAKKCDTAWVVMMTAMVKEQSEAGYVDVDVAYEAACKCMFDHVAAIEAPAEANENDNDQNEEQQKPNESAENDENDQKTENNEEEKPENEENNDKEDENVQNEDNGNNDDE